MRNAVVRLGIYHRLGKCPPLNALLPNTPFHSLLLLRSAPFHIHLLRHTAHSSFHCDAKHSYPRPMLDVGILDVAFFFSMEGISTLVTSSSTDNGSNEAVYDELPVLAQGWLGLVSSDRAF